MDEGDGYVLSVPGEEEGMGGFVEGFSLGDLRGLREGVGIICYLTLCYLGSLENFTRECPYWGSLVSFVKMCGVLRLREGGSQTCTASSVSGSACSAEDSSVFFLWGFRIATELCAFRS